MLPFLDYHDGVILSQVHCVVRVAVRVFAFFFEAGTHTAVYLFHFIFGER